jgi:hypothetical protein
MKTDDHSEFFEIFDGTIFQAQMLKNILENAGIEAFLKDEIIGSRSPLWSPSGGVKVMVADMDVDKAKVIAENYELK